MQAHASVECTGCEWERQPQAFRWLPELGTPLRLVEAVTAPLG
jgi:hypothetical protein